MRARNTMMISKRLLLIIALSINVSAMAMNLLQPYDTLIRPSYDGRKPFQLMLFGQTGINDKAFNCAGHSVNALRIWSPEQNALAMLEGFSDDSAIGQKRIQLDADDDGVRGHFRVCGDLKLDGAFALGFRYFFLQNWIVSAYLPVFVMRLKNVSWVDQTENVTDADLRVKEFLTNDFFTQVQRLGCLSLQGWRRAGPGDLTIFLDWFHDFPQMRRVLKNVRVNWRIGLGLPTGLRQDENKIMALPFGYDGAVSLPFGLGLDLTLGHHFKAGLDVQLTQIFGNTKCRRIKTNQQQTELLLLQKAESFKDFGLIQRFNFYGEAYHIYRGLSLKVGYQFMKRGDDTLSISSNGFNNEIANTAENLQEWTTHQAFAQIHYDFGAHRLFERVRPQLSIFSYIPFAGRRSVAITTIGVMFALDF